MIHSIRIEYRPSEKYDHSPNIDGEWELYKYICVEREEGGGSEIFLLRKAFGNKFHFRIVAQVDEPLVQMIYSGEAKGWDKIWE